MNPISCAAVLMLVAVPHLALAQARSASDPLDDCERFAVTESKKDGGSLKTIRIERGDSLIENRFDKKIGGQHVATEYIAFAAVEDAGGMRRARVVCLHAGTPANRAVYFVEMPTER
ncbi:hypothetical protein [Bosea sp. (in: a-proteobacteria)]|uniref:hypothetical protein n=1 Tax=Bosea sp. (in: a-proteobacteria) TaxID=1871050 RepID=UPI0027377438|nr:hypothetical protein [Bosea sp. (in: a-proteobacteria)]MDP3410673.1 hypothetical protein [Bosea sp. (in: a-proteobacteria)]